MHWVIVPHNAILQPPDASMFSISNTVQGIQIRHPPEDPIEKTEEKKSGLSKEILPPEAEIFRKNLEFVVTTLILEYFSVFSCFSCFACSSPSKSCLDCASFPFIQV
jgi:hypothetical protein